MFLHEILSVSSKADRKQSVSLILFIPLQCFYNHIMRDHLRAWRPCRTLSLVAPKIHSQRNTKETNLAQVNVGLAKLSIYHIHVYMYVCMRYVYPPYIPHQ